jgi:hypothetical protein
MARISTYAIDTNVTSEDKWIGTDYAGNITKNFTPQGVADWINSANAVGVAGQMNFKFQTDLIPSRSYGTVSFDAGGGNNTAFSSITTFKLSKYNAGNLLILDFLNILENEYVLFCQTDDINNFGVYKITDITQDVDETNFYDVALTLIASNGTMLEDEYYSLIAWPYNAGETNDKHYTHNQNSANSTWNITHNLGKHPSVSVVLSTGLQGFGAVTYIDNNNLTIAFSGPETGKAYMN